MFVDHVTRADAEMILNRLQRSSASMAVTQLRVLGGAMSRVPADATAFAHRNSRIMVNLAALYENPDEKEIHEAWVTEFAATLRQSDDGAYVNFLADVDEAQVRAAYPGGTWERLAAIKARYDPDNIFRLNQNIPPALEWMTSRQEKGKPIMSDDNKNAAVSFLKMVSSGKVDEAYSKFIGDGFKHHNPYFEGSADALRAGMKENAIQNPEEIH